MTAEEIYSRLAFARAGIGAKCIVGLKALAKDLKVPVIALAQLNRECDKEERPPRLSDLRDSGSIEQDADVVALLHWEDGGDMDSKPVSLAVCKNPSGSTGKVSLLFRRQFCHFESAAHARHKSGR